MRTALASLLVGALVAGGVAYVADTAVTVDCGQPKATTPALVYMIRAGSKAGAGARHLIDDGADPNKVMDQVRAAGREVGTAAGVVSLGVQAFGAKLNNRPDRPAVAAWQAQITEATAAALASCCPVINPVLSVNTPTPQPSQPYDVQNVAYQATRTTSKDHRVVAVDALRHAGFDERNVRIGVGVGVVESSLRWDAHNPAAGGNWGWLQINSAHKTLLRAGDWRDPYDNAEMAYHVWDAAAGKMGDGKGSWKPWSAWPKSARHEPRTLPSTPSRPHSPVVTLPAPMDGANALTPGVQPLTPAVGCPLPNITGTTSPVGATIGGKPGLVAELNPAGSGNWQGAVQDGSNWYVAQATASGTAVFHRLNSSGQEVDQMRASGAGHQTGFAVINGIVWTDWAGQIVTFPYRAGTWVEHSEVRPTGWRGEVSADPSRTQIVVRNGNRYRAYNLATRQQVGTTITTTPGMRQGFSIKGDALYVLSGATNQPARVDAYSFATGEQTGTVDVTASGYRPGEDPKHSDYREPEGMYGDLFGVKVFTGSDRRLRLFRLAHPTTAAVSSSSTVQVGKYRVPIPAGQAGAAVRFALRQVGKRYVWNTHGPDTFDCSGLTSAAWRAAGVRIYPQSETQNRTLRHVSKAQPGDILWHPGHVQLYLGVINGKPTVVEAANPRAGVRIDSSGWMDVKAILRPTGGTNT